MSDEESNWRNQKSRKRLNQNQTVSLQVSLSTLISTTATGRRRQFPVTFLFTAFSSRLLLLPPSTRYLKVLSL
ncbi:hypothetical protein M5K25_001078 [Dendrobium thyrsiflorum]|uniref:Uncharacterized protein n=1 Tax=Dendrobium thyrsiflorum TaxID=117978 RepID=A0ABD0WAL3_DENTH